MIEPKIIKSRVKIWRLAKDGFASEQATLYEGHGGTRLVYDNPLTIKDYSPKCDVCIVQEQGYACERLIEAPGLYEFEGGCMDCRYRCNRPPVHIGIRNYCKDHVSIMNKKLGVTRDVTKTTEIRN